MENFYVLEISTGDSKIAGSAVYKYDDLDSAVAAFHKKLGTAMSSDLYASELVMVINAVGGVHKSEYWKAEETTSEETE